MQLDLTCELKGYMKDGEVYFPLPKEDWEIIQVQDIICLKTKYKK